MHAQLYVTQGEEKGKSSALSPRNEPYSIGRCSKADVVLSDKTVSHRHASLEFMDGLWLISDMSSKHGTRVNGEIIRTRTALFDGDRIQLGKTELQYQEPSSPGGGGRF